MGRGEFKCTLVLTNDSNLDPSPFNLKNTCEALGLKVFLPMSHGDPIFLEYHASEPKLVATHVQATGVAATTPTYNAAPKIKRTYKKKK